MTTTTSTRSRSLAAGLAKGTHRYPKMNPLRLTVTIMVILCAIESALGESVEEFGARIRVAFASDDIRDVSKLYDWKDTDQIIRDQKLQEWVSWRSNGCKIEKIEFRPIEPNDGWDTHPNVKGEEVNGRTYKPNVRPTHILYLTFSGEGFSFIAYQPVVATGDGVRFPGIAITGKPKG